MDKHGSLSRDLTRPLNQRVITGWESLMVSHHPAKCDDHRHCGIGDMMFLVVEGQDSTCPRLNPSLLFISKANDMTCSHIQSFRTKTQ